MGLDWFSVATEASGGGTPNLFYSPMFLGYMDIYRRKKSARVATRGPRGWGALLPLELALDFPEEERMMQQSSISISLSF